MMSLNEMCAYKFFKLNFERFVQEINICIVVLVMDVTIALLHNIKTNLCT